MPNNTKTPKVNLEDLAAGQEKKEIEIRDLDGHKTGKKVELTLQDPGWDTKLSLMDLQNGGDYANYVDQLLENVLVNPRLSFKTMNEDIEADKDASKKDFTFTNKHGEKVTITATFPNYRDALILGNEASISTHGFVDDLNRYVLTDKDDNKLSFDFWDRNGGLTDILEDVSNFLAAGLNYNGFNQMISEADTFLSEKSN